MNRNACLVWLPGDQRVLGEEGDQAAYVVLGNKYAQAVRSCAQALPVLFPLAEAPEIAQMLELVDGVVLTGSPSNIHPSHFGQAIADTALPLDPARDSLTLPLVHACIEEGVPLLGLCRGFQEINVALGGTLHQQVHAVAGLMDHREPSDQPIDVQYAPSHAVHFEPASVFEHWAKAPEARVNSLHGQGIDRMARGLRALGHAPDGLIEAFGVQGAQAFAFAVQWHPEWGCTQGGLNAAIFAAFGESCRARAARRTTGTQEQAKDPWSSA